jgi:dGTPase
MPAEFAAAARAARQEQGEAGQARVVADYVAGMTDRYAIAEHERLTDPAVGNT